MVQQAVHLLLGQTERSGQADGGGAGRVAAELVPLLPAAARLPAEEVLLSSPGRGSGQETAEILVSPPVGTLHNRPVLKLGEAHGIPGGQGCSRTGSGTCTQWTDCSTPPTARAQSNLSGLEKSNMTLLQQTSCWQTSVRRPAQLILPELKKIRRTGGAAHLT